MALVMMETNLLTFHVTSKMQQIKELKETNYLLTEHQETWTATQGLLHMCSVSAAVRLP